MISDGTRLKIKLGKAVSAIRCLNDRVEVETTTGEIYSTDFVIVTVSLGVLKANRISFYPEPPQDFRTAVERLGDSYLGVGCLASYFRTVVEKDKVISYLGRV